ncbi:MAG: adenosylcobinamide-GDP ribazoletransferase [Magnetococcales bacterium]|nr:adenosylcobinamide-GDP ribazoletransferase [Magnetococcales bacterium]
MWRSWLIALGLLTRIPVVWSGTPATPLELGRSVLYYPLVGLLIGGVLAGLAQLAGSVPDAGVAAALLLIAWIWLTGGMHLEGLADTADGWVGGLGDATRALAILKDPRCGPFGVLALVLIVLLKWNLLRFLLSTQDWVWLLVAPLLGRVGIVALFLTLPYVRPGGMGTGAAAALPRGWGVMVCLLAVGLASVVTPWWVVVVWGMVLWLLRAAWLRRFGGVTGDISGATCELLETVVMTVWSF